MDLIWSLYSLLSVRRHNNRNFSMLHRCLIFLYVKTISSVLGPRVQFAVSFIEEQSIYLAECSTAFGIEQIHTVLICLMFVQSMQFKS
jgi:hypothetical protein